MVQKLDGFVKGLGFVDGFVKPSSCQWFAKTVYPLGVTTQVGSSLYIFRKKKVKVLATWACTCAFLCKPVP